MTTFYLIRHGEALYSLADERGLKGTTRELVPLNERGVTQIDKLCNELSQEDGQLIVSSPMTRALHSAAILSRKLDVPMQVEFDLREWISDLTYAYKGPESVLTAYAELLEMGGEWPKNVKKKWEPLSSVRERVTDTLQRYTYLERVFVVCHGTIISAMVGSSVNTGGFYTLELDGEENS